MLWAEDHDGHFYRYQTTPPSVGFSWLWFRNMMTYRGEKGYMTYEVIECATSRQYGNTAPYGYWRSGFIGAKPPEFVEGGYMFNSLMNYGSSWPRANKLTNHKRYTETAVAIDAWSVYWGPLDDNEISYRHRRKNSANVVWLDGHTSAEDPCRPFDGTDLYCNYPKQ